MKFKKSLLISSLVTLLATTTLYAGDDANGSGTGEGGATNGTSVGDTQTASIIIPEVSIIDVTNSISATLVAPTNAGDNFKKTAVTEKMNYDISTNISATTPEQTKKIIATSTNIPAGWKVYIKMDNPNSATSTGEQELTTSTTSKDLVTGIKNIAEKDIPMTLSIGPKNTGIMPSHTDSGAFDVKITYTITAGS